MCACVCVGVRAGVRASHLVLDELPDKDDDGRENEADDDGERHQPAERLRPHRVYVVVVLQWLVVDPREDQDELRDRPARSTLV